MLRYYLISSVLVLIAVTIVTAFYKRGPALDVAAVSAPGSPSPPRVQAASTLVPRPVTGSAPWALSALPECFRQTAQARGSAAFVRAHLPAAALPIAVPFSLRTGDCALLVTGPGAVVERGDERMAIPGPIRFYTAGKLFALIRGGALRFELRIYAQADGARPVIGALRRGRVPAPCRTSNRKC